MEFLSEHNGVWSLPQILCSRLSHYSGFHTEGFSWKFQDLDASHDFSFARSSKKMPASPAGCFSSGSGLGIRDEVMIVFWAMQFWVPGSTISMRLATRAPEAERDFPRDSNIS